MEEKESLGMVKKEVLEGRTEDKSGLIKKGFSEKLINFLLDDEEEEWINCLHIISDLSRVSCF